MGAQRRSSNPKPRRPSTPRVNLEGGEGKRYVTRQRRSKVMKDDGGEDPLSAPNSPPDENNNVSIPFCVISKICRLSPTEHYNHAIC